MRISIPDDYQDCIRSLRCYEMIKDHEITILTRHIDNIKLKVKALNDPEILVLTRTRTIVDDELLSNLPNLKMISQTGKNANHIDIEACTKRGIAVAESKGNPIATAELTWCLIMSGLRLIPQAINGMKTGNWQVNIGRRVYGKTIGIWGYGKIGRRIAKYADAFGAQVIIWGSDVSRQKALSDGYNTVNTKAEFFKSCDVISLHLRLKPSTRGIVRKEDLLMMKEDALLVNTARAGLIEPNGIIEALKHGRPGYAALDVFDEEPIFDSKHPLLQMPNVICTPHLGYVEQEGYELYFSQAFENVCAFIDGENSNIVNLDALNDQ